ncbi:MAG: YkvA family protein, partial [Spirochaetes bacterium]|nr:YkvA family protein [Spirochaetota bacterium]
MGCFEKRLNILARKIRALYFCIQDPEMPWFAKGIALLTVAYAVSPLDLIPDWIPILGYLDDLLILPIGIALVIYLTPREVYLRHLEASA